MLKNHGLEINNNKYQSQINIVHTFKCSSNLVHLVSNINLEVAIVFIKNYFFLHIKCPNKFDKTSKGMTSVEATLSVTPRIFLNINFISFNFYPFFDT